MKEANGTLKTVGGGEGAKCHYPTRLDTYVCGCQHDCSYCYAKSLLYFRKLWKPNSPKVVDPNRIRQKIYDLPRKTPAVRLGGMTDCFQPIENITRATFKTVQILNERRIPYLIVTKSNLVAYEDYLGVLDKDLAHIQITVTTTDDELSKTYEKAVVPSRRIEAIETLQRNGYDVALRLSPFIPEYIDFDKLARVECDKILVEFLRANGWIKRWFNIDYSEFTVNQGGYSHLPLGRKQELITRIYGFKEISVCEDEDEAYEYWRDHFNPNPDDCCNLRKVDLSKPKPSL